VLRLWKKYKSYPKLGLDPVKLGATRREPQK